MKSREKSKKPGKKDFARFAEAVLTLKNSRELKHFLDDLCTPSELEAMVDRWRAVELLQAGLTYREIASKTGMSVTTVGRVARCIEFGSGGYRVAIQRLSSKRKREARS